MKNIGSKNKKLRFRKKPKYKNILFLVICICLVVTSSGMALIQSIDTISGETTVSKITWDVHFANYKSTGTLGTTNATVLNASSPTTLNFQLNFNDPKKYYEFEVDVTNAGTLDAVISTAPTLTGLPSDVSSSMTYTFAYSDGTAIKVGDTLPKGTSKKIKFKINFIDTVDITNLLKTEHTFNLSFNIGYTQQGVK